MRSLRLTTLALPLCGAFHGISMTAQPAAVTQSRSEKRCPCRALRQFLACQQASELLVYDATHFNLLSIAVCRACLEGSLTHTHCLLSLLCAACIPVTTMCRRSFVEHAAAVSAVAGAAGVALVAPAFAEEAVATAAAGTDSFTTTETGLKYKV